MVFAAGKQKVLAWVSVAFLGAGAVVALELDRLALRRRARGAPR